MAINAESSVAIDTDSVLAGRSWAFDAVYTPEDTPFVIAARARGLAILGGFELFLFQGVDAFRIFTGHEVDAGELRRRLRRGDGTAASWA
jgi:shikimate dehydrogenase